jgi:hypothetical protein
MPDSIQPDPESIEGRATVPQQGNRNMVAWEQLSN